MSEGHEHTTLKYTVYLRRWWRCQKLVIIGTASSLKDGELLIFCKGDVLHSINYANVIRMTAEPVH